MGHGGRPGEGVHTPRPGLDYAAIARQILRRRRSRDQFFDDNLFADPAWDMLLDLFAASLEGKSVYVSSACIAASVPLTTAQRWLRELERVGLVERQHDPADKRRVFVRITARAYLSMMRWIDALT